MSLEYLAGFFDGEGSISFERRGVLRICVGQINPVPLRLFKQRYGGQLTRIRRKNPKHRDIYLWMVAAKQCVQVLQDLLPYLRVKRRQALLGLSWQKRMLHQGGNKGLPARERGARETIMKRMHALNHAPFAA